MRFRKKPVVIDAWQFKDRSEMTDALPVWLLEAIVGKTVIADEANNTLTIKTLEGDHLARVGDWIIRGVKGELYPCKPDIFDQTYESVPR
jgi:hypothetical protein